MTRSESPDEAGPRPRRRLRPRWVAGLAALALGILLALAQLVPYGHSTTNPPVTRAARIPDAVTRQLVSSACADCHSNLTKRWWATRIAPVSWLAESDVRGGRERLNLSEWDRPQPDLNDVIEAVQGGSMPPLQYRLAHAAARLSGAERDRLAAGLEHLYATDPPASSRGDD